MPVTTEILDLAHAERALSANRAARVLGGGTLLMSRVNAGDPGLRHLVRLEDPALAAVSTSGGRVRIGAGVTMAQILDHPDLACLHDAARAVGGPAIRNMGTVGGNLFAPAPYGDLAVMLLALDAQVVTAAGRAVPLADLWRGSTPLVVREVEFARPDTGQSGFAKQARTHPRGPAVVTVAVRLGREPRVAFGAVEAHPVLATRAAAKLARASLQPGTIEAAAVAAAEGLTPRTDSQASGWYRGEMMQVQLRRLLERMAKGGRT